MITKLHAVLLILAGLVIGIGIGFLLKPAAIKTDDSENSLKEIAAETSREFPFSKVIKETCGVEVLALPSPDHPLVVAIQDAATEVADVMSSPTSPAREKGRINEVSALFEDALRTELDRLPEISCGFPKTRNGDTQRSGYPDLRVEHLPTGTVAYLDPKLFASKSIDSSFRSFYFEPAGETIKVTEDAIHLLIGFPHDSKTGEWTFGKAHLVDLSTKRLKLKTEFSTSNRFLYSGD